MNLRLCFMLYYTQYGAAAGQLGCAQPVMVPRASARGQNEEECVKYV